MFQFFFFYSFATITDVSFLSSVFVEHTNTCLKTRFCVWCWWRWWWWCHTCICACLKSLHDIHLIWLNAVSLYTKNENERKRYLLYRIRTTNWMSLYWLWNLISFACRWFCWYFCRFVYASRLRTARSVWMPMKRCCVFFPFAFHFGFDVTWDLSCKYVSARAEGGDQR